MSLANVWTVSKHLHTRPSQQLRVEDAFAAYCLDSAVTRWGTAFEAALQDAVSDAKDAKSADKAQSRVVRRWLPSTVQYADPRQR